MPPHRSLALPLLAAALAVAPGNASAHGLDAGRITVELDGAVVVLVATPRTRSFAALDDDGDGLLALAEVRDHRPALRAAVDEAIVVTDRAGRAPMCDATDVSTPGSGHPGPVPPSDHVRVTRRCRFVAPPDGLLVRDAYAAEVPIVVDAYRHGSAAAERAVLSSASPVALLAAPGVPGAETDAPAPRPASSRAVDAGVLLGAALLGCAGILKKLRSDSDRKRRKGEATR